MSDTIDTDFDWLQPKTDISIGMIVKNWGEAFRPEEVAIGAECGIGLVVESRSVGNGAFSYLQWLVLWPKDGLVWEDSADLVAERNWHKSYGSWLTDGLSS